MRPCVAWISVSGRGRRFCDAWGCSRGWHLRTPNSEAFLQHLSSEEKRVEELGLSFCKDGTFQDLCWALHSDCQGTLVDRILEAGEGWSSYEKLEYEFRNLLPCEFC